MNPLRFHNTYIFVTILLLVLVLNSCADASEDIDYPNNSQPDNSIIESQMPDISEDGDVQPDDQQITPQPVPSYTYRIINMYSHDRSAFTQGLVFEDGIVFEGTGLYGESSLRKVDLRTGKLLQIHELPQEYFGEGIAIFEDRLIQLTWKSQLGFVYDKNSFNLLCSFSYPSEGWGITHDGERLIMSDGTSTLYFLNPETFDIVGSINVLENKMPIDRLNELEFINGRIYANVWQTDKIVIISPHSGQVEGWIDLAGLLDIISQEQSVGVLNGIAYNAQTKRLLVTGKLWPNIFEIELVIIE